MRLLFIAPEIKSTDEITEFNHVWSYFLTRELRSRGITVVFDRPLEEEGWTAAQIIDHYRSIDLYGIDHILSLGKTWMRYFERIPRICGTTLMQRVPGVVAQLHAHAGHRNPPCHATFCVLNERGDQRDSAICVGWAADPEYLHPDQDDDELRILVDHPDYGVGAWRYDMTEQVLGECLNFADSGMWKSKFERIRLRRLVDGGFEDFTTDTLDAKYQHQGVPYTEAAAEYRKAHMFLVTHRECIGLSVLETAMCGALVLVPEGGPRGIHFLFVPKDRLATVRHIVWGGHIRWGSVMDELDVAASRRKAEENNWKKVADNILAGIKQTAERERRPFTRM